MQVVITEILAREIEVQTDMEEEAVEIAERRYFDGEEVLTAADGVSVTFEVGSIEKTWQRTKEANRGDEQ